MKWLTGAWLAGLVLLGGCTASRREIAVGPDDPIVKVPAMKQAAKEKDAGRIPSLIRDLESEDAAVRFYAINALERLTGERFGYRYYDDEAEREESIVRWKEWLVRRSTTQPGVEGAAAGGRGGE